MKVVKLQGIITSLRAKADRSISFSVSTPELNSSEKALFFDLQNLITKITITPLDDAPEGEITIDADLENKSQSQRIRSVLFILWKQDSEGMDFPDYYRKRTEKIIDWLKTQINE